MIENIDTALMFQFSSNYISLRIKISYHFYYYCGSSEKKTLLVTRFKKQNFEINLLTEKLKITKTNTLNSFRRDDKFTI